MGWHVWGHEGQIGLNPEFWANADQVLAVETELRSGGFWNPNVPTGAGALSHELGHFVHDAVRLSFQTQGAADEYFKQIADIKRRLGRATRREVSYAAKKNLDEFIAEAVSEAIFSPSPRRTARQVYRLLVDAFEANTAKSTAFTFRSA